MLEGSDRGSQPSEIELQTAVSFLEYPKMGVVMPIKRERKDDLASQISDLITDQVNSCNTRYLSNFLTFARAHRNCCGLPL